MQNKNRVINKLALVLLSIVVLELVLIGDQVQPTKALKKKIYLKKLKKLLPLMALLKPKKKIILLPIPVPMFKNHGYQQHDAHHQFQRPHHQNNQPMSVVPSVGVMQQPPMSFMMMNESPPLGDAGVGGMSLLPMSEMIDSSIADSIMSGSGGRTQQQPTATNNSSSSSSSSSPQSQPMTLAVPSMTMTIQNEPGGSSAIELSTSLTNGQGPSVALLQQLPPQIQHQRPPSPFGKLRARPLQQQNQHQHQYQYQKHQQHYTEAGSGVSDEPGEQYYSSPWSSSGQPLVSPAKLIKNRDRPSIQQMHKPALSPVSFRLQQQLAASARSARPSSHLGRTQPHTEPPARYNKLQQQHLEQQQINDALEQEELVPVGPAQVMPVFQSSSGQLHISPPQTADSPSARPQTQAPASQLEQEHLSATQPNVESNDEVHTTLAGPQSDKQLAAPGMEVGPNQQQTPHQKSTTGTKTFGRPTSLNALKSQPQRKIPANNGGGY